MRDVYAEPAYAPSAHTACIPAAIPLEYAGGLGIMIASRSQSPQWVSLERNLKPERKIIMYAKELKCTDDYIKILKTFDNREKLKIISALTDSMLESQEEK